MRCPFCERNILTELMRNEHGNIAYDCPLCGIVHKSEFPKPVKRKRQKAVKITVAKDHLHR